MDFQQNEHRMESDNDYKQIDIKKMQTPLNQLTRNQKPSST